MSHLEELGRRARDVLAANDLGASRLGDLIETDKPVNPDLEVTGLQKHLDGACPMLFNKVTGKSLSELVQPLRRYAKSPEINFEVEDKQGKIEELARRYADAEIDYLDGITFQYPTWWGNVRPSNTEPFLRLVLEASSPEELAQRKAELFEILGEPAE